MPTCLKVTRLTKWSAALDFDSEGTEACFQCIQQYGTVVTATNYNDLLSAEHIDKLVAEIAAVLAKLGDIAAGLAALTRSVNGFVIPTPTLISFALDHMQRISAKASHIELADALRKIAGALERVSEDELAQKAGAGDDTDEDDDAEKDEKEPTRAKRQKQ